HSAPPDIPTLSLHHALPILRGHDCFLPPPSSTGPAWRGPPGAAIPEGGSRLPRERGLRLGRLVAPGVDHAAEALHRRLEPRAVPRRKAAVRRPARQLGELAGARFGLLEASPGPG